jgi:hypothetical protein
MDNDDFLLMEVNQDIPLYAVQLRIPVYPEVRRNPDNWDYFLLTATFVLN